MARKIFYSWQSWLPNASNRGFIHAALEDACDECAAHVSDAQRPEVDRDTLGVPGAPDIVGTIFAKIDTCDAFVADVSIAVVGSEGRGSPNPNVLVELGYAIKTLGWERIILVSNTSFGPIEALPFDLRTKRVTAYSVDPTPGAKAPEEKRLTAVLAVALRTILDRPTPAPDSKPSEKSGKVELVRCLQLIKSEATQMAEHAKELNIMLYSKNLPRDEWADRLLRLLRLRFHPEVIDGAIVHIAGELDAHRLLREQLNALRKTAHAADREAAEFVRRWGELTQWGDVVPLHRQAQEILTTAQLVVQATTERLVAIEKSSLDA